jgi:hypothetical protein
MRPLSWTLATTLACMILMALGTSYAATPVQITVTGADLAAGQVPPNPPFAPGSGIMFRRGASRPLSTFVTTVPPVTFGFFPADVQNPSHNPTLTNVTVHNIFVNPYTTATGGFSQGAAGSPTINDADTFVDHLNKSTMLQIANQYTGGTTATLGQSGVIDYLTWRTQYDADVAVLVHAAARTFNPGGGLNHFYHIYFPQGTDVCTSGGGNTAVCYSPDNPASFGFCAYHSALQFTDGQGTAVFSVEPYANVSGCSVPTSPAGASPNGPAIDSMADVVSHETFEAITDPLLNAWFNRFGAFAGEEIGDECAFVFALPPVVLNGMPYQIQSEYSNLTHSCVWEQ